MTHISLGIPESLHEVVIKAPKIEQMLDLIEDSSNLAGIAQLLKANDVPFTGTWKALREQRIMPALEDGRLKVSELVNLLRSSEEFGSQHVFLFSIVKSKAAGLVNEDTLRTKLKSLGRLDLLAEPDLLSVAGARALADARIETRDGHRSLILKSVEARTFYRLEDQHDEKGGRYRVKRYKRMQARAVDVLRIQSDGQAEMRIHAHDSGSDYSNQVTGAWNFFAHFVSRFEFDDESISKAQQTLWKRRNELRGILRYSDSRLRDSNGAVLTAATGAAQHNLWDNEKAVKSIDAFWDDETVCDKSNIWWLRTSEEPGSVPTRPIHMVMTGAPNEFTIPGRCSKEDFEYVLAQIRKANR